jgi:hypothetical protein
MLQRRALLLPAAIFNRRKASPLPPADLLVEGLLVPSMAVTAIESFDGTLPRSPIKQVAAPLEMDWNEPRLFSSFG